MLHPKTVSPEGLNLVKRFEGLHKLSENNMVHSYLCPAGVWTIGWGHTDGVTSESTATIAECENFLRQDLEDCARVIKNNVKVPLTQSQFDSLASFVFNLGAGNFKSSTLLKKLNKGEYDAVPEQLLRWNKATVEGKLKELPGLTRRRAAEATLFTVDFALPDDDDDAVMPQAVSQKATKPLAKSKTMAGAGIAGFGTIAQELAGNLRSLTAYSDTIETAFVVLSVLGIAIVAYSRIKDSKEGVH